MKKIYILHGWTYSTERWGPFIDQLMKGGFKVEFLKIPGLTAPLNEVWDIGNYTEWLGKILAKEKEKIILLGHSNGGLISLSYVLKNPEKVEKLILIDSTGIYHKEFSITLKRWIFGTAAKIGKKITKSQIAKKFLYKIAREHDYENASPIVQKTMRNLITTDYSQVLKNIRTSTIIIWGENDRVTPRKDGDFMNREIENSKLFIISDARHSPQLTHPKETAKVIIENI